MAISSDNGDRFSPWQELPTPGLTGCALTGPVVRWADGTIGFAFESFKEFDDPSPAHHAAWLLVSRDGGRSFEEPRLVARHPQNTVYYWDQRLCTGSGEGEFAALFWTHDLEQQKDLRVHFRYGNLGESQEAASDDARQPVSTGIPGQIAAPQQLDDGRFIAFVVDRNRPATMKLWVSSDNGRTWPKEDSVVIYTHEERAAISQGTEDVDFDQYWEDMQKWSFGHPAARVLDGNRVLLAYYAGAPDCMSIHWARVLL